MTSRPERVTSSETAPCWLGTVHWRNSHIITIVITIIIDVVVVAVVIAIALVVVPAIATSAAAVVRRRGGEVDRALRSAALGHGRTPHERRERARHRDPTDTGAECVRP